MARLIFCYATMNAGKSTALLQTAYNYRERGLGVLLATAAVDRRAGDGVIASRIGLRSAAETYGPADDLLALVRRSLDAGPLARVLVDEAQFLTREQTWQLARVADDLGIEVTCYGLRTDFRGELFEGSATLLAIADELRPLHTVCHCGREATMVVRHDAAGRAVTSGDQVRIGGNELYMPLCRRHWSEAVAAG